ncbi:alanine racemase [bacterium]|nr:alanine racemase [bacterium]
MNRVVIDLHKLQHNIDTVNGWMERHGASWTLVTKVLCGHHDTLRALQAIGVRSIGDSRLTNIRAIDRVYDNQENWYLRLPHFSAIPEIVERCEVSLNSEIDIIEAINLEARRQGRMHRIIIMIELGDLREGILPGSLVEFYEHVFSLSNIEVLGIGSNLGCLSGAVPSVEQMMQLALYRELLELKFKHPLPMISAGSSAWLPMLPEGRVPKEMNHFRIGESVFLGTDLISGGCLPDLHDDAITLEGEIVEIKEKGLIPLVETHDSLSSFEYSDDNEFTPGQRGYRALLSVGALDTDIGGLRPVDPGHRVIGGSSDLVVVYVGDDDAGLRLGDSIRFRLSYGALLKLMHSHYIDKVVTPGIEQYSAGLDSAQQVDVPRVIDMEDIATQP